MPSIISELAASSGSGYATEASEERTSSYFHFH